MIIDMLIEKDCAEHVIAKKVSQAIDSKQYAVIVVVGNECKDYDRKIPVDVFAHMDFLMTTNGKILIE